MARVLLKEITKSFEEVIAVDSLSLEVKDKDFLVLLGPSGCGKTTVLRCIAGLERPDAGEIYIGKRLVNDLDPKDRDIAMVFQSYALYPHMTVFDNMAFPLNNRKMQKSEIKKRVKSTAELLQIEELMKRKPKQLSGGQQQRVGVARALMQEPRMILADEPVASLDPGLVHSILERLEGLNRDDNITILCSLHYLDLVQRYSSSVIGLRDGEIVNRGTREDIQAMSDDEFKEIYGEEAERVGGITGDVEADVGGGQ